MPLALLIVWLATLNICSCASGILSKKDNPLKDQEETLQNQKYAPLNAIANPLDKKESRQTAAKRTKRRPANEQKSALVDTDIFASKKQQESLNSPTLMNAKKYLTWLRYGNRRFVNGFFRRDGASKVDRLAPLGEAKPHSAIWTCAHPAFPPEVLFDQKLNEIFVVRSLDLEIDENIQKALEYATQTLNISLIVILGGESCGDAKIQRQILASSSPVLRERYEQGLLMLVVASYDKTTGIVRFKR